MGLTQERGQRGEDLAAAFLQAKNYTIVARNVRTPHGEIDLICTHEEATVFVEVKYRRTAAFGHPEDAIPGNKLERLQASVEWYVEQKNLTGDYRLDVIAIEGEPPVIQHLHNVH